MLKFLFSAFYITSLLFGISAAIPIRNGLLPNGNFEKAPKPSALKGTRIIGSDALPSWRIEGFVEYISSGHRQGDMLVVVPQGAHAARLGNQAKLSQRMQVKKGTLYSLTFSVARTCSQMESLNVSVPPAAGMLPMQTVYTSTGWDSYAWAFRAAYDMVDIILHHPGVQEDPACGPLVDAIAIKELFMPRYAMGNLIKNGDFEEGPLVFRNSSYGVLLPPNVDDRSSPLPGWIINSLKSVKYIDALHYVVPQGRRAVELLAGKESSIAQIVRTEVGKAYLLSFTVGDGNNACNGSMIVEAFAARETVKVPYESKGTGGFKKAQLVFKAVSARTSVVFFSTFYHMRSDDFSSLCGPVIDDVKLVSHH
ncbi:hypothetical protein SUGI_0730060 [Cryptomeria japonica]|uniref:protein DUF642 L-GALACTONO-1,4-LACTONE-RESPONSIVE GENE 2 n=1 Tax=Cryptomeria japonica TaxID=3369 RepID=UPI002414C337|nr:protein DUF642 L-GALACTONO-1,4-LACTONE-RESPONSIVE GENE 2 [Cryptomeria japonica]GLJ36368.1 hypothetical protein SUGI_0730060 [Cryptomeria japonica]